MNTDNMKIMNNVFLAFIVGALFLALPFINIIYGGIYYKTLTCKEYIFDTNRYITDRRTNITVLEQYSIGADSALQLGHWTLINGIIWIPQLVSTMLLIYCLNKTQRKSIIFWSSLFFIVMTFLLFIWSIIGCVLLWTKCIIFEEQNLSTLIHITLLLEFIAIISTIQYFIITFLKMKTED